MGSLTGLRGIRGVPLERWFAAEGAPPRLDLARSGAAALTVGDLLAIAGPVTTEEFLRLSLDYGDGQGDERTRAAIVAAGAAPATDQVLVTHGAVEALLLACVAAAAPGEALVATPAYGALHHAPRAVGMQTRDVAAWQSGAQRLDLDRVGAAIGTATRVVLVNTPHNPSGLRATVAEIDDLARRCAAQGALLVVDEVSLGTSDPGAPSATTCAAYGEGLLVVCGDVSKSLGLGGLRVGWLATANRAVLDRAAAARDVTSLANARPSQFLAALALENRDMLTMRTADAAAVNLELLGALVHRSGGTWVRPDDGLVAFPALPLPAPSDQFARRLRRDADVSVVPGSLFGISGGRLRLGLGLDPATFGEGVARLAEAIGA